MLSRARFMPASMRASIRSPAVAGPRVHTILALRTTCTLLPISPGPDEFQRMPQVVGIVAGERHLLATRRMLERQLGRVQPLPFEPQLRREDRVGTVQRVADARMVQGGHVDADLMRTSRLEVDLEQTG